VENDLDLQNADVRGAVVILTTLGADADPMALGRTLVDERLAACVNVLPAMESIYRWKGAVAQEREQQLVIKTSPDRLEALKARVLALHPYETPELLVLSATGSEQYLKWMVEATRTG
jgi:periplasmic divalent cation tolerance protein